MPEAVGNARRERAVLLGTLHDPLGTRMPEELRTPRAGEADMSLCALCIHGLYSWGNWYCTSDGGLDPMTHEYVHGLESCKDRKLPEVRA